MPWVCKQPKISASQLCMSSPCDQGRTAVLTVIRRTHRVVESLYPTEFPFKSLRVFDRKRLYLVNRL